MPVPAHTALVLKGAAIGHTGKVLVIIPYIGEFLLGNITAVYRRVSAGKYISLMSCEKHPRAATP
jgi:hypothetical protein